ncbi:MAG TPA: hypothetical protein VH502_15255, partial [Actinoplanes sp.]
TVALPIFLTPVKPRGRLADTLSPFPPILELWLPLWAVHPLLRQPQLQCRREWGGRVGEPAARLDRREEDGKRNRAAPAELPLSTDADVSWFAARRRTSGSST